MHYNPLTLSTQNSKLQGQVAKFHIKFFVKAILTIKLDIAIY